MASRSLLALLAAAIVLAAVPSPARADRPLSDATCAAGEPATHHGGRRFFDDAVALGCAPLASGTRLQVDASAPSTRGPACLYFTFEVQGHFACPASLGDAAKPLLILHRARSPVLVLGATPAATDRAFLSYETRDGAHQMAAMRLIPVSAAVAEPLGAPGGFSVFVSEVGRDADLCAGVRALVERRKGNREAGPAVAPARNVMPHPDGWLAGFVPSWGIGVGPDAPRVCAPIAASRQADQALAQTVGLVTDVLWISGLTRGLG